MTYDIAFAWINIVALSAAVCVTVTWWPAAAQILHKRNRIIYVSTGVTGIAVGVVMARAVSFAYRTFNMPMLESLLLVGVSVEGFACALLAAAYYVKTPPRENTVASYRGVWFGLLAFAVLAFLWIFYRH